MSAENNDDIEVTVTKNSAEVFGMDVPGTVDYRVDSNDNRDFQVFDTKAEADREAERRHRETD